MFVTERGDVKRSQLIPLNVPFQITHKRRKSVMCRSRYNKKFAADFRHKKIPSFSDMVLEKRVYLGNAAAQKGKINTTLHHFDA
ncbi:MAG: hypothetical protein GY820_09295 [Gammaproteobacteria bacterium]|nr:hypothetical protein [Gammaproteobacteria bacterium]